MQKFYNRIRNFKLPKKEQVNAVFASFTRKEWLLFIGFFTLLVISTIAILQSINRSFMVDVPLREGSISIGIVGVPRFINPILATSEADQDLTTLIYSGLMRKSEDGTLIPDLASKYEMSPNGLIYTFTLKGDSYFHDGKQVTADDVLFTVNEAKDPIIKSPRKADWDGVTIEKIDDKTIKFTLKQPYALFLKSTTLGILPAHIWNGSPVELNNANTSPIGSGSYMIDQIGKLSSGVINSIKLEPFEDFALGEPYIQKMTLNFYQSESDMVDALENGKVDEISSITPLDAENLKEKNFKIDSSVLPRIFGLFFNPNNNRLFTDKTVMNAMNLAIDKDKIVKEVLFGYGTPIDGPIPPAIFTSTQNPPVVADREATLEKVRSDLAKAGWKQGVDGFLEKTTADNKKKKTTTKLEFSISTGNAPELAKAATLIKDDLGAIGMKVEVKTFETGNLNQNVIRPRKYEALLFGEIINNESDLFAFWHSSQRKDPGLNVAMYTNAKVDKILEEAFITVSDQTRMKKYAQFADEVKKDMGAIFLYSPSFIYVTREDIKEPKMAQISSPSDRYLNAHLWYKETENIWKVFTSK